MEKRFLAMSDIRAEQDSMKIGGYFVVFEDETRLWDGIYEKVSRKALDNTLDNDIRCLFNHDSAKVLGRNKSGTLTLKLDEKGLFGEVEINPKDPEALSVYEKVKRGDINQCSFGFNIRKESYEEKEDGLHYTLEEIDLHEVSIVTFPAYPNTEVSARSKDFERFKNEKLKLRKKALLERLGPNVN